MKAPILTFAFMSLGLVRVMSDDAQFVNAGQWPALVIPTGSVLGTDSTQSLDQLMEFVRDQDPGGSQRTHTGRPPLQD